MRYYFLARSIVRNIFRLLLALIAIACFILIRTSIWGMIFFVLLPAYAACNWDGVDAEKTDEEKIEEWEYFRDQILRYSPFRIAKWIKINLFTVPEGDGKDHS